jgi:uncharacterized membrane protein
MRIASLAVGAFLAVASIVPAAAEVQADFIKKPKALSGKMSTVTSYKAGPNDSSSGSSISCSGTCNSDGHTRYWTCMGTHADVACHLTCSPPRGGCLPF